MHQQKPTIERERSPSPEDTRLADSKWESDDEQNYEVDDDDDDDSDEDD